MEEAKADRWGSDEAITKAARDWQKKPSTARQANSNDW